MMCKGVRYDEKEEDVQKKKHKAFKSEEKGIPKMGKKY